MFQIEITVDGPWHVGYQSYMGARSNYKVCLIDLGFVQIKIMRRLKP